MFHETAELYDMSCQNVSKIIKMSLFVGMGMFYILYSKMTELAMFLIYFRNR